MLAGSTCELLPSTPCLAQGPCKPPRILPQGLGVQGSSLGLPPTRGLLESLRTASLGESLEERRAW